MRNGLAILSCALFLCGCGGSDGPTSLPSSPSVSSQVTTSLSSSPSLSSIPSVFSSSASSLTVVEVVYRLEEDQSLELHPRGDFGLADEQWQWKEDGQRSPMNGTITISDDGKSISYTPEEDFVGTDAVYYTDYISSSSPKRIKAIVNVTPVVDKLPKWKLRESQVIQSGLSASLPVPVYPDTGEFMMINDSSILTLDNIAIPYQLRENKIIFDVPVFERAGTFDLSLQQTGTNFSAPVQVTISDGPITYYLGNKNSAGSVLVMVRTLAVDDQQYRQWQLDQLIPFLREDLIKKYQPYWTFAVLDTPAQQKIRINEYVAGVGYVGGADPEYYIDFVNQYIPRNTEIIVLDGQQFRATGGYPITINIFDKTGTLFHEVGHSHAKLGDEYAESCKQEYPDDFYPNIEKTFSGDTAVLQWKHWISDVSSVPGYSAAGKKPEDTGAFLGAYYCSDRYYRPAFKTLMFNQMKPPGMVDKEVWVLANYENMGFLDSMVSEKKDGANQIRLTREFDPALTSIRWFVNDKEQVQFEGAAEIVIDESVIPGVNYSVKAELIDLTGMVRNPHAYLAFNDWVNTPPFGKRLTDLNSRFKRTWTFTTAKNDSTTAKNNTLKKSSLNTVPFSHQNWIEQGIEIAADEHKLLYTRRYRADEVLMPATGASDLIAEVIVDGDVLATVGVELKRFHFAELAAPLVNYPFYRLVHPAIEGPYHVNIYSLPANEKVAVFEFSGESAK